MHFFTNILLIYLQDDETAQKIGGGLQDALGKFGGRCKH